MLARLEPDSPECTFVTKQAHVVIGEDLFTAYLRVARGELGEPGSLSSRRAQHTPAGEALTALKRVLNPVHVIDWNATWRQVATLSATYGQDWRNFLQEEFTADREPTVEEQALALAGFAPTEPLGSSFRVLTNFALNVPDRVEHFSGERRNNSQNQPTDVVSLLWRLEALLAAEFPDVATTEQALRLEIDERLAFTLDLAESESRFWANKPSSVRAAVVGALGAGWTLWERRSPTWLADYCAGHGVQIELRRDPTYRREGDKEIMAGCIQANRD